MSLDAYSETLKEAVSTFGGESRLELTVEECSELIKAIQKYKRYDGISLEEEETLIDEVCEEIADVKIMVAQAEIIFGKDRIEFFVESKMDRLKKTIAEEKGKEKCKRQFGLWVKL